MCFYFLESSKVIYFWQHCCRLSLRLRGASDSAATYSAVSAPVSSLQLTPSTSRQCSTTSARNSSKTWQSGRRFSPSSSSTYRSPFLRVTSTRKTHSRSAKEKKSSKIMINVTTKRTWLKGELNLDQKWQSGDLFYIIMNEIHSRFNQFWVILNML